MRSLLRALVIAAIFAGAWPLQAAAPPPPSGLTATATGLSGQVQLSWDAVTTPAAVSGYQVYRASVPVAPLAYTYVTQTSSLESGLGDGAAWYFWVSSDDAGVGPGALGVSVSATPYQAPPGAPVLSATLLPFGAGASVTWTAPVLNGKALGAMRFYRSTGGAYSLAGSVGPAATNATLSLPCGIGVSLVARAVDVLGNSSAASNEVALSYPCAPALHAVSMDGGAIYLTWTPALNPVALPAGYRLYRSTGPAWSAGAGALEASFGALPLAGTTTAMPSGQTFWYRLHTIDTNGNSSVASNEVSLLAPPAGMTATALKGRVLLQWTRPSSAEARGLTAYQVFYSSCGAPVPLDACTSLTTVADSGTGTLMSVTLTGLADHRPYAFTVASQGGIAVSSVGATFTAIVATPGLARPAITSLQVLSGTALSLAWSAADVEGLEPATYKVYRADNVSLAGLTLLASVTLTAASALTPPAAGPAYYFVAVSDTAGNTSTLTPTAAGLVFAPGLAAPAISLTGSPANGRVQISWPAVADADSYRIFRATLGAAVDVFETQSGWVTAGLSFIDTKPVNSTQNVYAVRAERSLAPLSGGLAGPLSNCVTVTPKVLPGIPGRYFVANVNSQLGHITTVARPGGAGVDLLWRASDLGSNLLSGYQVYRGYSPGTLTPTAFVPAPTAEYYDPAPPLPYGSLVYGVQAVDQEGLVSVTVTSTVGNAVLWPAPVSLVGTVLSNGVRLSWASPTGKGTYPFADFAVSRRWIAGGPEDALANVTYTSYVDNAPDADQGAQPVYFVRMRDSRGLVGAAVSFTAALSGAVAVTTVPTAPVLISAEALTGAAAPVLLRWRPNPQSELVTAYEVWRDGGPLSLTVTTALSWTDSGLLPSVVTPHTYHVTALNSYGSSPISNVKTLYVAPPQPAWVSLTAEVDAAGATTPALHLSWQDLGAPSDVVAYQVFRASPASAPMAYLDTTTQTAYADSSPPLGVAVAYGVLSVLSGTASYQAVTQASSPALDLPVQPLGLTATAGDGVALAWNSVATAREYWVFRSTGGLVDPPALATLLTRTVATSYIDASFASDAVIYYGVAALNALGRGTAASVTVTPLPGPPLNLDAVPTGASLTASLSWSPPSAPRTASSYRIYRGTSAAIALAGLTLVASTSATSYVDSIPAPLTNTAIFYVVNSVDLGERWSSSAVWMKSFSKPSGPLGVSATGSANGVDLRWLPAADDQGVDAYRVSVTVGVQPAYSVLLGGVLQYALTGVTPGTTVSFAVAALNNGAAQSSDWSATVSAMANAAGAAAGPLGVTATVGFRETLPSLSRVKLSWSPLGSGVTAIVYRAQGPLDLGQAVGGQSSPYYYAATTATVSRYEDLSVTAMQAYSYAVSAVSADGLPGGESAAVGTGPVVPFNHTELVALSATAGDARVDLQWAAPTYTGSYPLAAEPYLLYRHKTNTAPAFKSLAPDPGFPMAFPLSTTAWTDTYGLLNDSTYFYFMSTVNANGDESPQAQFPRVSAELINSAAPMTPRGPLMPPSNLTAVAGNNSVALRWTAQKGDALSKAKYNVYRRPANGSYAGPLPELFQLGPEAGAYVGDITQILMSWRDGTNAATKPVNRQAYCYCLAVVNSAGEGPKSMEVCATPFLPLGPPAGGTVLGLEVVGKKDVKLQWATAVPVDLSRAAEAYSLVGYRIYRSENGGNTYALLSETASTTQVYTDTSTVFGLAYLYRVVPFDSGGNEGLSYSLQTVVIPASRNAVLVFKNAFNPAVGETLPVQFSLQQPGHAWVKVFTLNGEYVATLFDEDVPAASGDVPYLSQKLTWNGANAAGQIVASGVYILHLEATGFRTNARVAVIK